MGKKKKKKKKKKIEKKEIKKKPFTFAFPLLWKYRTAA